MKIYTLESKVLLPKPIGEVFEFFSNAHNLEQLTPGWLKFEVLTPAPIEMRPRALIDYRLRLRGFPIRWQSEITVWQPPYRFVDEQRRGPYRQWIHEHRFSETDGNTLVEDRVRYAVPGGALANRLIVAPDLRRVFAYRVQQMNRILGAPDAG